MRKKYKRGGSNTSQTTVAPVLSYPLAEGASSQRDSSILASSNMNAKQQSMNDQHGGKKCPYCNHELSNSTRRKGYKQKKTRRRRRRRSYSRGGNANNRTTVPSFSSNTVSPTNATSISASSNSASLQSNANAAGDCYATNTC